MARLTKLDVMSICELVGIPIYPHRNMELLTTGLNGYLEEREREEMADLIDADKADEAIIHLWDHAGSKGVEVGRGFSANDE